jgi:hypothetical protein
MSLLMIDDQGELWRGDSRKLRIAFDSPYSGGEFCEYAIKNLGFVAINLYGLSCQVRLRPKFIGEKTHKSLIDWLRRGKMQRVVLSVFEKEWRDELVHSKQIEGRLEALLPASTPARPGDFLCKPMPVESLDARPKLRDVVASWPFLVQNYDVDTLLKVIRSVFDDRFVVVRQSEPQSRLVFSQIGEKLYGPYDTWRSCAVGAPIEEQPDRDFGRWIADTYYSASKARAPQNDAVDSLVRLPAGRSRFCYRRLIFPMPPTSTGQHLIGGSILDPTIDLRVANA